ncbi:hypothetical protein EVAR_11856_1 [Eumeta japonica]|uniref:Uncharacterized protein n=1 Tax=Eumeta variegata TaxID=151549 RepID=A0A4C1U7N4_EUMVA|nr:hypothetical protein EVAR_11856_1 [Eumeta japonica]
MLWPTLLQHKNGPARPVKYQTLAKYGREVAASAIAFLPVNESFGVLTPLYPPLDISFLPKNKMNRLWSSECPWAAVTTHSPMADLLAHFFLEYAIKNTPSHTFVNAFVADARPHTMRALHHTNKIVRRQAPSLAPRDCLGPRAPRPGPRAAAAD